MTGEASAMNGGNRLTIVVVTYNSARFVRACLSSLIANRPRMSHRIVVVDNASSDTTAEIIEAGFPDVELIRLPENIGFGRGNNAGMAHAPAQYYYLHNADAYLQEDVLTPAVEMLDERPDIAIAGLPLVYPDHTPQVAAHAASTPAKWLIQATGLVPFVRRQVARNPDGILARTIRATPFGRSFATTYGSKKAFVTPYDWVCGASMFIRHDALEALDGGFDPQIFIYGEDEDICLRARDEGYTVVQIDTTPVIHEFGWGTSVRSSQVVVDHKLKGLSVMIDRHFSKRPIARLTMRVLLRLKHIGWSLAARRN